MLTPIEVVDSTLSGLLPRRVGVRGKPTILTVGNDETEERWCPPHPVKLLQKGTVKLGSWVEGLSTDMRAKT